jgi:hypothetical protein
VIRSGRDKKQFMYEYGQLVGTESRRTRLHAEAIQLPGVYTYQSGQPNQRAVPDEQFNATYAKWSELWRVAYDEWEKAKNLTQMVEDRHLNLDRSIGDTLQECAFNAADTTSLCLTAIEHMDAAQLGLTIEQLRASRVQAG